MKSEELLFVAEAVVELSIAFQNRLESFLCLPVNLATLFMLLPDHEGYAGKDANCFEQYQDGSEEQIAEDANDDAF